MLLHSLGPLNGEGKALSSSSVWKKGQKGVVEER